MSRRAFVVMPFNTKSVEWHPEGTGPGSDSPASARVDFNALYDLLLKKALEAAGYEVARADSEPDPGDVRASMFFELVTADLVVTDISVPNPNVFYELGVRQGVCPRGVFLVRGRETAPPPFDVGPDRHFLYDLKPFVEGAVRHAADLDSMVAALAQLFERATALDRTTDTSPVYSHLPGLKPVDWDDIDTARARYFGSLQTDWLQRVRRAQQEGRPGDILTLAANAPTRFHESKILYEAAVALIDLCRYEAAERVLRQTDPEDRRAALQHALVLNRLGKTSEAQDKLNAIVRQPGGQAPQAKDLLGQVNRHLWHLSWCREPRAHRHAKALQSSAYAERAIRAFLDAHGADPSLYFAGFNALMLDFVLRTISPPDRSLKVDIDRDGLTAVVNYVARTELAKPREQGNTNDYFWCTTTLAGIDFMAGRYEDAQEKIEEACAVDTPTTFQLQSFEARLQLIDDLDLETYSPFLKKALRTVGDTLKKRFTTCGCERLFVWLESSNPNQAATDWPADLEQSLRAEIEALFGRERVGASDLCVCGGLTEGDVVFAEAAQSLGAKVRVMQRAAVGDEASRPLWPFRSARWQQRWEALTAVSPGKEIWSDTDFLGEITDAASGHAGTLAIRRHQQWILNTVEMEAQAVARGTTTTRRTVYGVFLGDEEPVHDDQRALFQQLRAMGALVRPISVREAAG